MVIDRVYIRRKSNSARYVTGEILGLRKQCCAFAYFGCVCRPKQVVEISRHSIVTPELDIDLLKETPGCDTHSDLVCQFFSLESP